MSLNWNISKVANHDIVCFNYPEGENGPRQLRQTTERLIWATIVVDLGSITARNIDEWLFRLDCAARIYEDREGYGAITREDLTKHIGLSTNVTNGTRAAFLKHMNRALTRLGEDAVRHAALDAAA